LRAMGETPLECDGRNVAHREEFLFRGDWRYTGFTLTATARVTSSTTLSPTWI
jgi:hypothetical protein